MYTTSKGVPDLGYQLDDKGANFGIFSQQASSMVLAIYSLESDKWPIYKTTLKKEFNATGDIFHIYIEGIKERMIYTWQIVDQKGNISHSLIDPYAYCIEQDGEEDIFYKNVIIKKEDPQSPKPNIPWEKTIIYELHIGSFTNHPSSGVAPHERGTFRGLIGKLDYLKQLGITTLEILPIFKWNKYTIKNKNPMTGELLQDVWGYNPISFFAVDEKYSVHKTGTGVIKEFKALVEAAHQKGIEIILDVVYNHTGEGGKEGTYSSFKNLALNTYYKLNEQGEYLNCSGTGNTLNTNHVVVKKLILESLKYWVVHMGVDGFRFDLASILGQDQDGRWMAHSLLDDINQHPILSHVKLISESWDAKGSYDVGRMPYHFREWSDNFRDTVRKFMRGDLGLTKSIADCLLGKEIFFSDISKDSSHTLHFITAHDGFTMWDLLSYELKHNLENGEANNDGHNANYGTNCGIEGDTEDLAILNMRRRRVKNYMCLLLLSKGIPMLLMGDEMGRTQKGNNNAFCQDNEIVWLDWKRGEAFRDLFLFTKSLIEMRKKVLEAVEDIKEEASVTWHGICYNKPDWSYYSRSIACHITGKYGGIYMIINSYHEALTFELPPTDLVWLRVIDTNIEEAICFPGVPVEDNKYLAEGYSICVFKEISV